jgi:hypothetical protein
MQLVQDNYQIQTIVHIVVLHIISRAHINILYIVQIKVFFLSCEMII